MRSRGASGSRNEMGSKAALEHNKWDSEEHLTLKKNRVPGGASDSKTIKGLRGASKKIKCDLEECDKCRSDVILSV